MNKLTPVQQKFVLHWGEMGLRWGINRTVAQVHALLFLSPQPLNADDLTGLLGVARSNISFCLRELQRWGIVKVTHVMGDRRDHFECMKDVWEMFRLILNERKKREIDPTVQLLRECAADAEKGREEYARERLSEMRDFLEAMSGWYDQIDAMSTPMVVKFVKLGDKLRKILG